MNPILVLLLRVLLVLLAYLFIGWIGYAIFSDLRKGTSAAGPTAIPPITLVAELESETISKQFNAPQLIIGRDPASNFSLNHPTISLRHCKIAFHHKQWWAEDLDSTNGSYLNNSQINSPIVLTDGDELRLGEVFITINFN